MEGNGHLGPEKSGSKVPKSPAKTPNANGQSVSGGPGRREELRSYRDAHLICSTPPLEHRTAGGVARVARGHTEPERGKQ